MKTEECVDFYFLKYQIDPISYYHSKVGNCIIFNVSKG